MSDISKITLLDGTTYDVKDPIARSRIPWGVMDPTSTSTKYLITVDEITELKNGVCFIVMNNKVTSASGYVLDVNGLGEKPVYTVTAAATRSTTGFAVNYTWMFVYNETRVSGGCWDMVYLYNTNSTADAAFAASRPTTTSIIKMKTVLYRYQILLSYDETTMFPVNNTSNSTATTKTLTTEEFNPFGLIAYYGTTTTVKANAYITSTSFYFSSASADLQYSFNTGSTLIKGEDVYLVAVPQSNGKAVLHTTPITQRLPTEEDGLIYIYLGKAISTTSIHLMHAKPVYYYADGAIRLWTNAKKPVSVSVDDETKTLSITT